MWINSDSLDNARAIAQTLQHEVEEHPGFKAFLIFVSTPQADVEALATKANVPGLGLAILHGKDDQAVQIYAMNVDPEVKNTILVYRDKHVKSKFINLVANRAGLASLQDAVDAVNR